MSGLVYTDSIFNVIGDYPIVDQFDVSYINLLTGSITDQYVTGTLFQKYSKGSTFSPFGADPFGESIVYGERGLAFSKCNPNNFKRFPGTDDSYGLQSWGERSGISRCIRIFSNRERYYDSMTPFYDKMMNILGGSPVLDVGGGSGAVTFLSIGLSGSQVFTPSTYPEPTAIGFHETFPFESKFRQIARSQKILDNYDGQGVLIAEEGQPDVIVWSNSYTAPLILEPLKSSDIGKLLFGFGSRRKKIVQLGPDGSQSKLPGIRKIVPVIGGYVGIGPIISGWKYGLVSALPYYTSAVFRRDKYGQFRDMLEQRPVAVTVIDSVHSPMKYFGDVETPAFTSQPDIFEQPQKKSDDGSTKFTVKVAFSKLTLVSKFNLISGTTGDALEYVNLNPSETASSNHSTFVTSSLPFFEV